MGHVANIPNKLIPDLNSSHRGLLCYLPDPPPQWTSSVVNSSRRSRFLPRWQENPVTMASGLETAGFAIQISRLVNETALGLYQFLREVRSAGESAR